MVSKKDLLEALNKTERDVDCGPYSFVVSVIKNLPDDELEYTKIEIPEWEKIFEEQQRLNAYPREGQWMAATKSFIRKEFKKMGEEISVCLAPHWQHIVNEALKRRGIE